MTSRENASRSNSRDALATLVDTIGGDRFGPALARYLNELCGAHHVAAFRLDGQQPLEVAASCVEPERTARSLVDSYVTHGWWKRDPALTQAQRFPAALYPSLIHVDLSDESYAAIRPTLWPQVSDRLLLYGHAANADFSLSILRADSQAPFAVDAIGEVKRSAEVLMSFVSKHANLQQSRPNVAKALMALSEIENIVATSELSCREAQVTSRILYGLTSVGIARDLALSEETVKTYRKRIYQRLSIGCERELLTWYLARWSRWHGHNFDTASSGIVH